ncbi:MAG TPA: MMPL family transporter [Acidimicrobiales bacterium]|nr:MMPL family transporter [Acidimicrobiales bacterium]
MFGRLGSFCFRRRRLVAVAWVVALLVLGSVQGAVGTAFQDEFTLPDVESRTGFDILEEHFGGQGTGVTGTIVFKADQGVDDPQVRAAMERLFSDLDARDDVTIASPYEEGGERRIASQGPLAGRIAYAELEMPQDTPFEETATLATEILAEAPDIPGLQVEVGGAAFAEFAEPSSEVLGLAFAIVILILAFGSVLAMGLPVGVALAGIGVGTILVSLLSNLLTLPDFATVLGVMIGLGVGIDYALFIVTRYRESLHRGDSIEDSIHTALDTAGRAVTFAGTTVVISLLGMLVMQVSFVSGLAIGAATVVAVTVIASLTLLPALLGFAGRKVEVTRWRGLIAAGLVAVALVGVGLGVSPLMVGLPLAVVVLAASFAYAPLRREVPRFGQKPIRETLSYRWSRFIQHRPWQTAIAGAVVLTILAIPVLGMRLGFSDEGNFDRKTTTRRAYDLLAEGFGPGFNGTFMLAAELPPGTTEEELAAVTDAVAADRGVAFVTPPILDNPDAPSAALWRMVPRTAPQDEATTQTVNRLRGDVLPPVEAQMGVEVAVTGGVPVGVDFSNYLTDRLPLFFTAVLGLSFLLLMTVFRSVLVPLKAVLMNMLSLGAAYGVVVAVFQWGWLSDITGVEPAPIEPFVPMMLFAIVFGLSMDYEVFLLSRVREEWLRTGDSRTSVADGLASTARVITAAAAIMVFLFGSFLLESDRLIKLFGLGLAVAVLLDATIIRMLLVPATMELLGDKNWWLPRWLGHVLPKVHIEGNAEHMPERQLEKV